MSAENVRRTIEALNQVLSDVKEAVGQETPAQKITYIGYEARTKKLIDELGYLLEDFFDEIDFPEEPEGDDPR